MVNKIEEEEQTGKDYKYHLKTLFLIIGALTLVYLMYYQSPGYSDMNFGKISAVIIVCVLGLRNVL